MLVQDSGKRNTDLLPPNSSLSFLHSISEWKARLFFPNRLHIYVFVYSLTLRTSYTLSKHITADLLLQPPHTEGLLRKPERLVERSWLPSGARSSCWYPGDSRKWMKFLLCKVTFGELKIQEVQWSEKTLGRKMDPQLLEFSHWEEVIKSPTWWGYDTGLGSLQKSFDRN